MQEREKYWFWEKKITGERLRKVAKNKWNSIQDACDRSLPSLQIKGNRAEALAHRLAVIRRRQPTRRESGNDRQPPWQQIERDGGRWRCWGGGKPDLRV
jgi:hypothetical protein